MLYHVDFIHVGGFGVDIFFIISGFIIYYVSSINADHFLLKRAFRILPLYWLGTLGVFAIAFTLPRLLTGTIANTGNLAKSLAMIPYRREDGNVFPVLFLGWTLEYEVFFYAVLGLALTCFGRRGQLAAAVALGLIAIFGVTATSLPTVLWFYSSPVVLEFVMGMGLYALWRRTPNFASVPVALAIVAAGCGFALLVIGATWVTRSNRFIVAGIPALLVVFGVLALEGRVRFPKWLLLIGDASYSLYLFHPYVIQLADRKLVPLATLTPLSFVTAAIAVLVCYLIAYASFILVERPSNLLLRRTFLSDQRQVSREPAVAFHH